MKIYFIIFIIKKLLRLIKNLKSVKMVKKMNTRILPLWWLSIIMKILFYPILLSLS